MHQFETTHVQGGTACAAVPSGLGMNRAAQRFRKESVSVDGAMRNTYLHTQVGATRWARQDSTSWIAVAIQDAGSCLGILRTLDKGRAFRSFLV
jgi:hypothetical protein